MYLTEFMPASRDVGGCGLLTVKLRQTTFDGYTVLFCGQETVMIGGTVPGIGSVVSKMMKGFAFVTLTNSTPAASENKSDKTIVTAKAILFMPLMPPKCTNNTVRESKEKDFYQETLTKTGSIWSRKFDQNTSRMVNGTESGFT
jgi:hypothetical protein